jgi:hypothetical protein
MKKGEMNEKQIAMMRAMSDRGLHRTEIAVRVGCSEMTVFNRLKEYRTEKRAMTFEREAIVAWLRGPNIDGVVEEACVIAADMIERGDHLKVKP